MLGVQLPSGPLTLALADQPGVVATPSKWRAWVQIPSRVLTRRVGWALASPSGCNPPATAVQVQLLPDTLHDGLVAQPADHPRLERGMLGVQLPPGPLNDALADQPGVVATPSPWRAWVQIPPRVLKRRVGWALASPGGCNPPAPAVQVQLLPDTLQYGLVAQLAEHLSLKQGDVGSTPTGATGSMTGRVV